MSIAALLHFDGLNGSTDFIDETGNSVAVFGSAQLSSTGQTFGSACGLFDGSSSCRLEITPANALFLNSDCTVRFITNLDAYTADWTALFRFYSASGTLFSLYASDTGELKIYTAWLALNSGFTLSLATDYRISVELYAGEIYIYVDGTLIVNTAFDNTGFGQVSLIAVGGTVDDENLVGRLDEFMIDSSVSLAAGASSYVVESAPFSVLSAAMIEHELICRLLPALAVIAIEHSLPCPMFPTAHIEQSLSCPLVGMAFVEQSLLCPLMGIAVTEHRLKINDVAQIGHDLKIGQWTASYTVHYLPVLMASIIRTEHSLACPLASINQAIQQAHLLSVPMLSATDSVVIDVHSPEIPRYGSYA